MEGTKRIDLELTKPLRGNAHVVFTGPHRIVLRGTVKSRGYWYRLESWWIYTAKATLNTVGDWRKVYQRVNLTSGENAHDTRPTKWETGHALSVALFGQALEQLQDQQGFNCLREASIAQWSWYAENQAEKVERLHEQIQKAERARARAEDQVQSLSTPQAHETFAGCAPSDFQWTEGECVSCHNFVPVRRDFSVYPQDKIQGFCLECMIDEE